MTNEKKAKKSSVDTKRRSEPVWWPECSWEVELQFKDWWKFKSTSVGDSKNTRATKKAGEFPSKNGFFGWSFKGREGGKDPIEEIIRGLESFR